MADPLFNTSKDGLYQQTRVKEFFKKTCPLVTFYKKVVLAPYTSSVAATSAYATRKLLDAGITTSNVLPGSLLMIRDTTDTEDNGDYRVISVAAGEVTVDRDWPYGSKTGLTVEIRMFDERGDPTGQTFFETAAEAGFAIPTLVMLQPTNQQLTKYGFDKPRDAICLMSTLAHDTAFAEAQGLRSGDRFKDALGREHEIEEVRYIDWFMNTNLSLRIILGTNVTHKEVRLS